MTRQHYRSALAALILILSSLAWGGRPAAHAALSRAGSIVEQTKMAGPYKLLLSIGPLEHMYTMAQYKRMHPKDGEIMVSGTMVMGGMGMNGPMPNHHLELHVYDGMTGKTISKVMVSITIRDATGMLVEKLPIAAMYGIKEGLSDFHFGNNVALKNGTYQVAAQVNATRVTFKVTVGKAAGGMSM